MRKIQVNAEKVNRTGLIIAFVGIALALFMLVFLIGYAFRVFVG